MKHTKGPWNIGIGNDVGPDDDYYVEWVTAGPAQLHEDNAEADANLIAAAPEMLEALEELAMFYKEIDQDHPEYLDRAINVIAKAKGE